MKRPQKVIRLPECVRVILHTAYCVTYIYKTIFQNDWVNKKYTLRKRDLSRFEFKGVSCQHSNYDDVIMDAMASLITSLTIVYSTVYSDADQRKHQSSASLAFVWGIDRGPVNSPHKWPVTRKMFPFDYVIMMIPIIKIRRSHDRTFWF